MSIQISKIFINTNALDYVADDKLIKAVEIALALGKPLLVSGEPGTGKTRLADYVAKQLQLQTAGTETEFLEDPLIYNTKSTSVATDLFYHYDAVSHFRSQQAGLATEQFIELRPFGTAIVQTHGLDSSQMNAIRGIRNFNGKYIQPAPRSTVVLIDEIDKASREFPNDILNEIEKYEFSIKEMNQLVERAENDCRILVIMTSNSEKNLPNAFLRRCIFYHIDFPDKEKLLNIAKKRLTINNTEYDSLIGKAIDEFNTIRNNALNKKPSTSEFLDWINLLQHFHLLNESAFSPDRKDGSEALLLDAAKSTLIKNFEDQQAVNNKASR